MGEHNVVFVDNIIQPGTQIVKALTVLALRITGRISGCFCFDYTAEEIVVDGAGTIDLASFAPPSGGENFVFLDDNNAG